MNRTAVRITLLIGVALTLICLPPTCAEPDRTTPEPTAFAPVERSTTPATRRPEDRPRAARDLDTGLPGWLRRAVLEGREDPESNDTGQTCQLTGTLVVDGTPWVKVPGLRVRLTRTWLDTVVPTETKLPDEHFLAPEAVSDEHGRFAIGPVPIAGTMFLVFQDDRRVIEMRKVREFPRPGQTLEIGDIEITPRGTVRGRIVDRRGRGRGGIAVRAVHDAFNAGPTASPVLHTARVTLAAHFRSDRLHTTRRFRKRARSRDRILPFPSTTTDASGRFVLTGVRRGTVTLFLNGPAGVGIANEVLVDANKITEVGDLLVDRGIPIRLRITEHTPTHVEGALVSVRPVDWPVGVAAVRTDAQGECSVHVPGDRFEVRVKRRGWPTWQSLGTASRRDTPGVLTFRLPRENTVRVRVRDTEGDYILDSHVALFTRDLHGRRVLVSVQPYHGARVRGFADVPRFAPLEFLAWAPGYAPSVHATDWLRGVEMTLHRPTSLRILAIDPQGKPLAGVRVAVRFLQTRREASKSGEHWHKLTDDGSIRLGHTDADGRLHVTGLWPGRMAIAATHADYTETPTPAFRLEPGITCTIKMRHSARLDGRLRLDGQPPLRRFEIHATPREHFSIDYDESSFFGRHRTVTATDGSFYFNDLFEGAWVLRVHALAAASWTKQARAWPEGATSTVDVKSDIRVAHVVDLKSDGQAFRIVGKIQTVGRPCAVPLHVSVRRVEIPPTREYVEVPSRSGSMIVFTPGSKPDPPRLGRILAKVATAAGASFALPLPKSGKYIVFLQAVVAGRVQTFATREVEITNDDRKNGVECDFRLAIADLRLIVSNPHGKRIGRRVVRLRQRVPGKNTQRLAHPGATLIIRTNGDGIADLVGVPAGMYELLEQAKRSGRPMFARGSSVLIEADTLSTRFLRTQW